MSGRQKLEALVEQALAGKLDSTERDKARTAALLTIAVILDEMAGPYCGHGERARSCPYSHNGESFREGL